MEHALAYMIESAQMTSSEMHIANLMERAASIIDARKRHDESLAVDYQEPPRIPQEDKIVRAPAHQNPYASEFKKAAKTAGVPESWATNSSILEIVRRESSFKPDAKNPASSAFGLFQLLKSTWEQFVKEAEYGTESVFWQAVGGFRYIRKEYETPENAKMFWDSTMQRQVNENLPERLRKKAAYWIKRGYVGY